MTAKQDVVRQDSHDEMDMTVSGPTTVQRHLTPLRGNFKVNIPGLSVDQLEFYRPISRQRQSDGRYVTFPSMFSQTFQIPAQAMSTKLTVVTSLPIDKSCQTSRESTLKLANEAAMVDIAWEDYSQEQLGVITKNTDSPTKEKFTSINRESPTFPITEAIGTFPFKPIPASSQFTTLSTPTTTQSHSPIVLSSPSTIPNLIIPKSRPHQNDSTICYEWNYYMPCAVTKFPRCPHLHVCEICSSPEHRATQHWHHLATAPLPEIQSQPKLSSFAPPPESPTLSALRELRARPRVVSPAKSVGGSVQEGPMFGLHPVPLSVPSFGLSGGMTPSSSDLLKPIKRPCRTIQASSPQPMETKKSFDRELTALEGEDVRITGIPTTAYPFENPLEVILPPPVKPFQRKAATVENFVPREPTPPPGPTTSQPATSTPGRLRVTAPVFEPSSSPSSSPPSAWVPFTGSNPQFNNLFKIPSRQNRRIAIIPPPEKHKEPKERKPGSTSDQGENERRETEVGEEKEGCVKSKGYFSDRESQMRESEKPPDKNKDGNESISSSGPGPTSMKILTIKKYDTSSPTSSASIGKTDSGIRADSIHTHTMANFDNLEDQFHIYAKIWRPLQGPRDVKPNSSPSSDEITPGLASALCLDSVDQSVIAIVDDELEAIMAKASEEEVANALETIIEICTTSSSSSAATTSQQSKLPQHRPLPNSSPARNSPLSTPTRPGLAVPKSRFITLEDFADDVDSALTRLATADGPTFTERVRPRSSDSSSTAPLSPCDSPQLARSIDNCAPSASGVPFRRLESRLEQMISCAAARGEEHCDCGLGDWFHHGTGR